MKSELLRIKKRKRFSNYELALDIGVSEFTVYNILNDYCISHKRQTVSKIRDYIGAVQ